tara:strand:- start:36235 stop:37134 length:900 start_codon:yes stop_codon:yes gene_type:complete
MQSNQSNSGFFNIDKPIGVTSMDVVRKIRKEINLKKIGHGGTLDPLATGVLPIAIGNATRLLEYVLNHSKTYIAEIEIGKTSNTYDSEGDFSNQKPYDHITKSIIDVELNNFKGIINQTPPIFSAIKKDGVRMYQLARQGIDVKIPSRQVEIKALELKKYNPPYLTIKINCSKGFYVRSFAHELGNKIGTGAYLKSLNRIVSGDMSIENSVPLNFLIEQLKHKDYSNLITNFDTVLSHIPKEKLAEEESIKLKSGQKILHNHSISQNELLRVFDHNDVFFGIAEFIHTENILKPVKMFI